MRLEDMHIQPYTHNAYSSCFSSKYVALVFPRRYRELQIKVCTVCSSHNYVLVTQLSDHVSLSLKFISNLCLLFTCKQHSFLLALCSYLPNDLRTSLHSSLPALFLGLHIQFCPLQYCTSGCGDLGTQGELLLQLGVCC